MFNENELSNYYDEYGMNMRNGLYFKRNIFVQGIIGKERISYIDSLRKDNDNTDLFKRIYSSDKENVDDSLIYGPLYFDFDIDEIENPTNFKKVRADVNEAITALTEDWGIPSNLINLYFSGAKGFHIIIEPTIIDVEPKKDLNMDYKTIAIEIRNQTAYKTIDTRIYDKSRLFRIENSINSKTGLYKIPLKCEELMDYNYDEIIELAKKPRIIINQVSEKSEAVKEASKMYKNRLKKYKQYIAMKPLKKKKNKEENKDINNNNNNKNKELLPCIVEGISDGAPIGTRNNILVALSSGLFQFNLPVEDVTEFMIEWNENNDEPLSEREIVTTVKSAYKMFNEGKKYGCEAFKALGLCTGSGCKIYDKAEEDK